MTTLVHYLYNLSFNSALYADYCKDLPTELYSKTIKNRKNEGKAMLNPDLEPETVTLILKVLTQLILRPKQEEEEAACLGTFGKLLKADLNTASIEEDIAFIK